MSAVERIVNAEFKLRFTPRAERPRPMNHATNAVKDLLTQARNAAAEGDADFASVLREHAEQIADAAMQRIERRETGT
jgi:hypothetical protein